MGIALYPNHLAIASKDDDDKNTYDNNKDVDDYDIGDADDAKGSDGGRESRDTKDNTDDEKGASDGKDPAIGKEPAGDQKDVHKGNVDFDDDNKNDKDDDNTDINSAHHRKVILALLIDYPNYSHCILCTHIYVIRLENMPNRDLLKLPKR